MSAQKKEEPCLRIGYTDRIFSRPEFEAIAGTQLYNREFKLVMRAYRFAKNGHKGRYRRDKNRRYFDHCKGVALIIMLEFRVFKGVPIMVGLMHDLQEDEFILTWEDIEEIFGKDVYRGLRIISKERGKDYYFGIRTVEPKDWWVIMDKCADRLYNMRDILNESKRFMTKQLRETEKVFPELIDILETMIPRRYKYLPNYIREELEFACNRVREKLSRPSSKVFKRTP